MNKFKKFGVIGLVVMALALVAAFSVNKSSADASTKKEYSVKLYKGNTNANGFETKTVKIKNLTAYSIIKELKAYGAVAQGVKANSLDFKGKYLTLDLSKEFAEDISSAGTSGEYVKVGAVVNTFIDAFKVDTLTITVEGKAWDSGHVTYDMPLEKFAYNVALYVGNANADGFDIINAQINNKTAYSILQELKVAGAVASNVKANSLEYVNGNLTLDLSKEFAEDVANSGSAGEYIKVGCVVNTFIDAFDVDTLTITVEGKAWESGHVTYDRPLSKFQ
jgi:spore germination protein GerM